MPENVLGLGVSAGRKRDPTLLPMGRIPGRSRRVNSYKPASAGKVREDFLEQAPCKLPCEGAEGGPAWCLGKTAVPGDFSSSSPTPPSPPIPLKVEQLCRKTFLIGCIFCRYILYNKSFLSSFFKTNCNSFVNTGFCRLHRVPVSL